ncbi:MAG: hypothetical protein M1830_000050 [Pleopsidium flavum]|nr:MAG: hypothetical protein M1830_000050 [Pleopsidium flavum]
MSLAVMTPPPLRLEPKSARKILTLTARPRHMRTWSSPPTSPGSHGGATESVFPNQVGAGTLTPPLTPTKARKRRSSASEYDIMQIPEVRRENAVKVMGGDVETAVVDHPKEEERSWTRTQPLKYTGRYELVPGNRASGYQEYGRGVWSAVFKATETLTPQELGVEVFGIPTPPASPSTISPYEQRPARRFLAVKAPIRRDAQQILEKEARILTYLHHFREVNNYVITFHGFEPMRHTLVLNAVPLTMDWYIKTAAKGARENLSTRTIFDPVIGVSQWLRLCKDLIDGLAFLHSKKVVHGDIKPMNILLDPPAIQVDEAVIEYQPLYCDFSSSHLNEPGKEAEQVSAVTAEFTAPELLQALRHNNGQRAITTFESDVFGLGVTLLTAATGESPYVSARFEAQRTAMAMEGAPLVFARRGEQASRVRPKAIVDAVIHGAVENDESKRLTVNQWQDALTEIAGIDPEKR